ncbi:amino acid permease [Paenibacillus mucilaginosus]|uniref:Amino acid permease n=1 Tax=Paenibacillus mucilaginosus (strain KNP414) TaxID=1036673 RepID=F8FM74_PAEMK|nr:amino acid permease [Paenibacillus mucilaginosus]AEI38882.1 amino acid permease [Paenibacillus mucilaginosus KNP414]MCG7217296.1 amino acid permease [Paenibacillus mucilaginosus]WDM27945.1 amino acid permease [Paenibacillus mucilaginosus]
MNSSGGLQRTIGLPQAVALYIGAVLGSGILIVPGLAAEIAGPASLLAWGLMALLIFPLAWSMGLLSAQFPNAGGVSHFVTLAYGRRAGTLTGWFFLMSVPIGAPVAALTGAGYMTAALGWGEQAKIAIAAGMLVLALLVNYVGMKIAGQLQLIVVLAILAVLILAIAGAQPHIQAGNLTPFLPHGWVSVGQAAAILFWCFIGWEAVSHLSEEFQEPKKAAIQGVTAAALIVGVLYFLTAFAVVGTGSYRGAASDASLVWVILRLLGPAGAWISGITGIFICTATIIAYAGASSRLAYALAREGEAPRWMGGLSARFGTPTGGLGFLAITAAAVLTLYGSGAVSLAELIQFPNATFILTYLGGCAAGMKLLRGSRWGKRVSTLSFACTLTVFPFVGWAMLYPIVIVLVYWLVSRVRAAKASRSRSASQAS